jgi:hypothetical protein
LAQPRLAFALIAEPVEPEVDAARRPYRQALAGEFERLIRAALDGGHLPDQDAALSSAALVGLLIGGLVGPLAPAAASAAARRAHVQGIALLSLRALGVADARARGLVVQIALPA